ncbi:MAG: malonic semialdehyde reductase [Proteobacteria bacterium]|nr:malonic semialdehyde reductase [Pseudomonadota bacterium]
MTALSQAALAQLFTDARSLHSFRPEAVSDATLAELYDLLKWGPTAFNAQPGRYLFLRTAAAKARLAPALMPANLKKTLAAPVTVIIAMDVKFYEQLPRLFPAYDAKAMFEPNPALAASTAFRNTSLQAAYLMIAARALGLTCGPMSGFDADKLNAEFFADGRAQANFLCNLGYADVAGAKPRDPRLAFAEACQLL